jgi:pimeloyl-ACP methyl ester carboxylesterase
VTVVARDASCISRNPHPTHMLERDFANAAVDAPLTYQLLIPKYRLMVIAGAGDRLAPPKHAPLLWDHRDRPRIHWFPGNHLIHFDQGKYLKEMVSFFGTIDF